MFCVKGKQIWKNVTEVLKIQFLPTNPKVDIPLIPHLDIVTFA